MNDMSECRVESHAVTEETRVSSWFDESNGQITLYISVTTPTGVRVTGCLAPEPMSSFALREYFEHEPDGYVIFVGDKPSPDTLIFHDEVQGLFSVHGLFVGIKNVDLVCFVDLFKKHHAELTTLLANSDIGSTP